MSFALGSGYTFTAARPSPYLHHADNNWTNLDLFGTHLKRTGGKASTIWQSTRSAKGTVAFPLNIWKMAFVSVLGWISSAKAKTRKLCLRLGDSNSTSLDLFGTHFKRTGRKASAI